MARTTVNVDRSLARKARKALGTKGLSDTVNAALAVVVDRAELADFDVRLFSVSLESVRDIRRPRV